MWVDNRVVRRLGRHMRECLLVLQRGIGKQGIRDIYMYSYKVDVRVGVRVGIRNVRGYQQGSEGVNE